MLIETYHLDFYGGLFRIKEEHPHALPCRPDMFMAVRNWKLKYKSDCCGDIVHCSLIGKFPVTLCELIEIEGQIS